VVRAIDRLESVSDQPLPTGLRETDEIAQRLAAAARERAAAERIRDRFLGMVSHELRTPLSAMIGWATVLQKMPADAATLSRGLAAIERNGRAQARLIDDLLDLTRMDEGKLRLERRRLSLDEVVRAAIETVQADALTKNVTLDVEYDATPTVEGDAARLQQVFWNLLGNALKFSPAGGRIGIRLDSDGAWARCAVIDGGAGIDPAFLPFVFEPFRQGSADAGVGSQGGLGLGLAIARRIVEAHGGRIRASSAGAGTGATFEVMLPLAATEAAG
jgi:signal transduction histidine kinase